MGNVTQYVLEGAHFGFAQNGRKKPNTNRKKDLCARCEQKCARRRALFAKLVCANQENFAHHKPPATFSPV